MKNTEKELKEEKTPKSKGNKFSILKIKYEKLKAENRNLKEMFKEHKSMFDIFKQNFEVAKSNMIGLDQKNKELLAQVSSDKETIDKLNSYISPKKSRKESSDVISRYVETTSSPFTTKPDTNSQNDLVWRNSKYQDKDTVLISLKKLEDLESSFYETTKNFNILAQKYKILYTTNELNEKKLESQNSYITNLKHRFNTLNDDLINAKLELSKQISINKCIMDISIESYSRNEINKPTNLNIIDNNTSVISIVNDEEEDSNETIHREPVPTLLKFLKNSSTL